MFTGLVADLGRVVAIERSTDGVRLRVVTKLAEELGEGDSVAVNGVCLTATAIEPEADAIEPEADLHGTFEADVMNETLSLTSLAQITTGSTVNLELPMRPSDRLGGHIVQGHVDGVGRILGTVEDGFSRRVTVEPPAELLRYVVHKGSIAVDGVSLTVAAVNERSFTVSLIPETLERTNLGDAEAGRTVNLEVDVLAKYVERLIQR